MEKIINSKLADRFLGLVIPLVMIYTASICLWSYFGIKGKETGTLDVLIIFLLSFLLIYGIKSLLMDLKMFGICWTLKNFFAGSMKVY